jgi:hypothetical protein
MCWGRCVFISAWRIYFVAGVSAITCDALKIAGGRVLKRLSADAVQATPLEIKKLLIELVRSGRR